MVNIDTRPMENSIGVVKRIWPPHIVPIQLKILMPVGTAMNIVAMPKEASATGPKPAVNMWWAHTPQPMKPMAMPEKTIAE